MVTLCSHLNPEQADTFSLVLNASGIGHRVIGAKDGFRIEVPQPNAEAAWKAIGRYQAENPTTAADLATRYNAPPKIPVSGIVVALLLLCVHLSATTSSAPGDYIRVFGANARRIMDGEAYRCATALVLHADAAHIVGNMVGIVLFGGAVCTITGSGVGWLMILATGILGNWINAFAYETSHLSVGASTSVFGAVGILCVLQAINAVKSGRGWKRTVLVFGAGLALLAFLGTSARSDLGAHLFGFFSGVMMGGAYRLGMAAEPLGRKMQILFGALAAATLTLSWIRGVTG